MWQDRQPAALNRTLPFATSAVWAGMAARQWDEGCSNRRRGRAPPRRGRASDRKNAWNGAAWAIPPYSAARYFSWQPLQAAPEAGKAALRPASSVRGLESRRPPCRGPSRRRRSRRHRSRFPAWLPVFTRGARLRRRRPRHPWRRAFGRASLIDLAASWTSGGVIGRLALEHRHERLHGLHVGLHLGLAGGDHVIGGAGGKACPGTVASRCRGPAPRQLSCSSSSQDFPDGDEAGERGGHDGAPRAIA